MANSITFTIEGLTDTELVITELGDGTLLVTIETLDSGALGDLRGVFFDMDTADSALIDGLSVDGLDVTGFQAGMDSVTNLGGGVNVSGDVANALGPFDAGISIGTPGIGMGDDIQSTSFVLSSSAGDLTLEMFSEVDFALQYTSVESGRGQRMGGEKLGGQSSEAIIAVDDTLPVAEDATNAVNVFANDPPAAGLTLTGGKTDAGVLSLDANAVTTADGRTGTLTLSADGTAAFDATGPDFDSLALAETDTLIFTYAALAANGSTTCADVTVTVTGVNDRPTAVDDFADATEDGFGVPIAVLANDFDVDSDDDSSTLTVIAASAASGATVNLSGIAGGPIGYLPATADFDFLDEGETTTDTIIYTVADSHGATDTASVTVTVTGVDDAPVAVDDEGEVGEDGPAITINVFANDSDADGAGDPLTIQSIDTTATLGSVSLLDLNGNVSYDPNGQFADLDTGESAFDSFSYTLVDEAGATSTATVTVEVIGRDTIVRNRVIEPDDAPAEQDLTNFYEGVELTHRTEQNGAQSSETVVSRVDDDASTGDQVFSQQSEASSGWLGSDILGILDPDVMRATFENPVSFVGLDYIAVTDALELEDPRGYLAVYDSDGTLLESTSATGTDGLDEKGEIATLSISRPAGDIAYAEFITITSLTLSELNFDHLVFTELI